jgi:starvation-inducible DNA-binding protein
MKDELLDIGIAEYDRKKIADGVSKVLADTYVLYLKTQNFHWNVTGSNFQLFHGLFESQYREMSEAVDSLAEHIRYLGFQAPGAFHEFLKLSSIREAVGVVPAREMIRQLLLGHESIVKNARNGATLADASQDQATASLLVSRVQAHEKAAWILRSHLMD